MPVPQAEPRAVRYGAMTTHATVAQHDAVYVFLARATLAVGITLALLAGTTGVVLGSLRLGAWVVPAACAVLYARSRLRRLDTA
jgi:hypothetical protein